jgi:hypothetical protein
MSIESTKAIVFSQATGFSDWLYRGDGLRVLWGKYQTRLAVEERRHQLLQDEVATKSGHILLLDPAMQTCPKLAPVNHLHVQKGALPVTFPYGGTDHQNRDLE